MNALNEEQSNARESAQEVVEKVKTVASEKCSLACERASDIVKKNPVPVVLGALAFGAAVGYLIFSSRETSVADRFVRETRSARDRLSEAPGFLSSLFHDGYDAASRQANKASAYVHDLPTDDVVASISSTLDRISKRLKFW